MAAILAHMRTLQMMNSDEVALEIAHRARSRRLDLNLTQRGLSARAGISLGSLKRFERTGQIAFVSLIRIAVVLDAITELESWFEAPEFRSIDEALANAKQRQRGRRS